jgi:hypothetical protein
VKAIVDCHAVTTERTALTGLYAGNPKRATAHPTTERLLDGVQGLTLTIIREDRRRRSHLTPLSRVQRHILALLNFPTRRALTAATRRMPVRWGPAHGDQQNHPLCLHGSDASDRSRENRHDEIKKLLPMRHRGSHINAKQEPRLEEGVGSRLVIGRLCCFQ